MATLGWADLLILGLALALEPTPEKNLGCCMRAGPRLGQVGRPLWQEVRNSEEVCCKGFWVPQVSRIH